MTRNELIDFLTHHLYAKLENLNALAKDLGDSLTGESKSTAGDKHDTGRAMIHLEQEKLAGQFNQIQDQLHGLNQIKQRVNRQENVEIGSLVKLGIHFYFIGIPAGKILFQEQTVWCIGHQAPLAMLLIGKRNGDQVVFNQETVTIQVCS
jgi:hypothetical protein